MINEYKILATNDYMQGPTEYIAQKIGAVEPETINVDDPEMFLDIDGNVYPAATEDEADLEPIPGHNDRWVQHDILVAPGTEYVEGMDQDPTIPKFHLYRYYKSGKTKGNFTPKEAYKLVFADHEAPINPAEVEPAAGGKRYFLPMHGDRCDGCSKGGDDTPFYIATTRKFTRKEIRAIHTDVEAYKQKDEAWNYAGIKRIFNRHAKRLGILATVNNLVAYSGYYMG